MDIPPERTGPPPGISLGGRLALGLGGGIIFGVGLIFTSAHGFGGLFLWSVMFAFGTGLALALFWNRRGTSWYWVTAALLIVAHLTALAIFKWQMLSRESTQFGSAPMMKGAVFGDFAVSALIMYVARGFFDADARAKTQPLFVAKAIKLGMAVLTLLIPAAIAILVWSHRPHG